MSRTRVAPRLRHRGDLQRSTISRGTTGGPEETWETRKTVWVGIEPMSGREVFQAQQVEARVTHRLTMRYDEALAVTAKDRLKVGSRIFNFDRVTNVGERNRWTEVLAVEAT